MTMTPENPMPVNVLVDQISSPVSGVLDDNYGGEESVEITESGVLTIGFEGLDDRDPEVYENDGTALYTDAKYQFVQRERLVDYLSGILSAQTVEKTMEDLFHE